jgi:DNA-binding MarR family transcriptional regulator
MSKQSRIQLVEELGSSLETLRKKLSPSEEELQNSNFTQSQSRVMLLVLIHSFKNGISIKDLAEQLDISSSGASQLVDGLIDSNMLIRKEDPDDRRKILIKPTSKARKSIIEFKESMVVRLNKQTNNLSVVELNQLISLLNKIN